MNQPAKNHLAAVIAIAYGTGAAHVGDSAQAQAEADTDIAGNLIGSGSSSFAASGALITATFVIDFTTNATAQEVAILDQSGILVDRFIMPATQIRAGGRLPMTWSMEVL